MPPLVWLGCKWRVAADDLPLIGATFVVGRALLIMAVVQYVVAARAMFDAWHLSVALLNAVGIGLAVLMAQRGSRGTILESKPRDASVRPVLNALLTLSLFELICVVWGLVTMRSVGSCVIAVVYAVALAFGFITLLLLWVGDWQHRPADSWALDLTRRLCVCTKGVTEQTLELMATLIVQAAPELDLTLSDFVAALLLVSAAQTRQEKAAAAAESISARAVDGPAAIAQSDGHRRADGVGGGSSSSYSVSPLRADRLGYRLLIDDGEGEPSRISLLCALLLRLTPRFAQRRLGVDDGAALASRAAPLPSSGSRAASISGSELEALERHMWYALGVYGWPIHVYRRSSRCCCPLVAPVEFASLCCAAVGESVSAARRRAPVAPPWPWEMASAVRDPAWCHLNRTAMEMTLRNAASEEHVYGGKGSRRGGHNSGGGQSDDGVPGGGAAGPRAATDTGFRSLSGEANRRRSNVADGLDSSAGQAAAAAFDADLNAARLDGAACASRAPSTKQPQLVHGTWKNEVGRTPYCVFVDSHEREVVLSVRGSFSLEDCVTDALALPAPLPAGVDGAADGSGHAHSGMLQAALGLLEDIEVSGVLHQLLRVSDAPCSGFTLVLTGHSLGAGVASILAILLRRQWAAEHPAVCERIRCSAFSPPGGLLSTAVAEATRAFTTTAFVENDWVPRLSLRNVQLLTDECVAALASCTEPKLALMHNALRSCHDSCTRGGGEVSLDAPFVSYDEEDPIPLAPAGALPRKTEVGSGAKASARPQHLAPTRAGAELLAEHRASRKSWACALWPPGRLYRLRRFGAEEDEWCAEEVQRLEEMQVIRLAPSMVTDHFPHRVLAAIQSARKVEKVRTATRAQA